jgi:hypothetical protein
MSLLADKSNAEERIQENKVYVTPIEDLANIPERGVEL